VTLPSDVFDGPIYNARAHYERVKPLYDVYPFKDNDSCAAHADALFKPILKSKKLPSDAILDSLHETICDMLIFEEIYLREFKFNFLDDPQFREFNKRRLTREEKFYSNYKAVLGPMETGILHFFDAFLREAPQAVYIEEKNPSITIHLIECCREAKQVIHAVVMFFAFEKSNGQTVYPKLSDQLWKNLLEVSKLKPEQVVDRPDRFIFPPLFEGSPTETCLAYLKETPFLEFLMIPLPFKIPDDVRFEHTHVLGGSGHGKTQFLQHQIMTDLSVPNPRSLIVVDSQGEMLNKIRQLAIFAPGQRLSDRLVIIDPEDDYSPALNVFDMTNARLSGYSRNHREQIEAGIIELYNYVFGSLAAEMTQKQGTAFSYVARLMLSVPGATIHTLLDLMEDRAQSIDRSPFAPHIQSLDPRSQAYFQNQFFHSSSTQTKQAVARRLYGLVRVPAFNRMFSAPRNKLDMFEAMQGGKIVLINTSKTLLKADASALFGRYMIALALYAAQERVAVPEEMRRPTFLIVDEAEEYFDENLETLLSQVRKAKLGLLFAHQYLDQLSPALRSSVAANTSVKIAGGVSDRDARSLAPDMRCSPDFITAMAKRQKSTEFACYVRNLTPHAIRIEVPFGTLEAAPKMTDAARADVLARNRERYAVQSYEGETQQKPKVEQPGTVTQQPISQSPIRSNPDDVSTDAASKW